MLFSEPLHLIAPAQVRRSHRASSYDRAGGNIDFRRIPAGGRLRLLDADGPGVVTHIWFALTHMDYNYTRRLVLKIWWDGADEPSVNCPLGDFFGVGHAATNRYQSLLTGMVRGSGLRGQETGVNAWFSMPYRHHVRIEVINESPSPCQACYFMVDWLQTEAAAIDGAGYFHAQWRRENPTASTPVSAQNPLAQGRFGHNTTGQDNYLVADISGQGRFIGMNLSVDNIVREAAGGRVGAFGEGDEMIFIDDDVWPPSFHGTGTEDYFTDAWGMSGDANLYAGCSLYPNLSRESRQRGTCYRYHVADPIYFRERLRFGIESGHDNCQANDLASTAYWYQESPQGMPLLPSEERLPRHFPGDPDLAEEAALIVLLGETVDRWYDFFIDGTPAQVDAIAVGQAGAALGLCCQLREKFRTGEVGLSEIRSQLEPSREALEHVATLG